MKPKLSWLKSSHALVWLVAILGLLILLATGCRQTKPATHTQSVTDSITTVTIRTRTDTVKVPGGIVRDTLYFDSQPDAPMPAFVPIYRTDTVTKVDSSGRAQLRYWRDQYGRLVQECTALEQELHRQATDTTRTTTVTTDTHTETVVVKEAKPRRQGLPLWITLVCILALALLFLYILKRILP